MSFTEFDYNTFLNYLSSLNFNEILFLVVPPVIGLILAFALGIFLNHQVSSYINNHPSLHKTSLKTAVIHGCKGLPFLFIVAFYVYFVVQILELPTAVDNLLSYLLFTVLAFTVLRCISRTANALAGAYIDRSDNMLETTLLSNVISFCVYSVGIVIILAECGIPIAPIVTAMGIGGMAVALGMQEGMANLFSGLFLIFSRQIHIGDYIRISTGQEGQVSDITWRYTTVSNVSGNTIIVPNKTIAASILTNFSMPAEDIKIKIQCGVAYDSDLDQVEAVTMEVARDVQLAVTKDRLAQDGIVPESDTLPLPEPAINFHTFGDSAIQFSVSLNCKEFSHQYKMKHEFIKALTKRFREEGIIIPYPIVSVINESTETE